MNKKKIQSTQKIFCCSQLLIEYLEEAELTTPLMIEYKTNLINLSEHLIDQSANTLLIQKSTYFHRLINKIDTIIRKEFQDIN